MGTDIRISVEFLDHPKTIKLERRLGVDGLKSLLCLWLWSRVNRPCGLLHGMDAEDIEIAAKWKGSPGEFFNVALTLRWLDVNAALTGNSEVEYSLHDWGDHNSWAVGSEARSDASRFTRMAKTHADLYEKLKSEGRKSITMEEFRELTGVNATLTRRKRDVNAPLTPSPSPSPSPSPVPSPIDRGKKFTPPTLPQVTAYCQERKNGIDPEKFIAHYETTGWMYGKTKMKNWKSAIITWEKNQRERGGNRQPKTFTEMKDQKIRQAINEFVEGAE